LPARSGPLARLTRTPAPARQVQAPRKATAVHVKRALLNVYLFCYAPLTQVRETPRRPRSRANFSLF
jgi:hypothetical protein